MRANKVTRKIERMFGERMFDKLADPWYRDLESLDRQTWLLVLPPDFRGGSSELPVIPPSLTYIETYIVIS